ncbi:MAG: TRAP transporter small permease [Desulfobacteraceae bacterium]
MGSFWRAIDWISDKLKVAGAFCLAGMAFLTFADVVGRLFRHPLFGSREIVTFMATLAVAMALPYTHKIKGHVGVEILVRLLSEKTQKIVDICTGILSLGLFAIVTWRMTTYAHTMQASGEVSMNLALPTHYIIYATGFCLLIFTFVILHDIIDDIRKVTSK